MYVFKNPIKDKYRSFCPSQQTTEVPMTGLFNKFEIVKKWSVNGNIEVRSIGKLYKVWFNSLTVGGESVRCYRNCLVAEELLIVGWLDRWGRKFYSPETRPPHTTALRLVKSVSDVFSIVRFSMGSLTQHWNFCKRTRPTIFSQNRL